MDNFEIKEVETETFGELWTTHAKKFYEDKSQIFRLRDSLSEEESEKIKALHSHTGTPLRINLGLYHNDQFIGWSWGYQESAFKFYMCNSAIFPEYRRKGLYTLLLNKMIDKVAQLGFQEIYSRHTVTNNAVIIPKLKAGFTITSMEVSDLFGTLIILSYYPKELRRKILDYRVGQIKPDNEIKEALHT